MITKEMIDRINWLAYKKKTLGLSETEQEEQKKNFYYNDRIQERIQEFQQQIIKRKDDFRQQKIDDFFAAIEVDEDGNTVVEETIEITKK